ncbi:type IX secretion system membrane protein PorP/SprF [Sphingobacterium alkalisoli]|uniref:Type IX secretion system membrane protein PorP/SprF n=1 Tax=Sphingobacterium alkalisoli TaxID=1874115 RepID=A0A4U0GQX4_9SPHI|nr:type IX secretion system membrane protein PorP/SprF [Sphingobacterium alkalisoli]TJY61350.1 type IX secretion system membrane protein PorP/SprF [Sphingobacterium alkalisoli]
MISYRLKAIYLLILIIIACIQQLFAQQNIQFTQYIFNSMSVNPAYAGYKEEWFGQMALRSQWLGVDGGIKTGLLSLDGVIDEHDRRHGVGAQITVDALGAQAASSLYANYALRLQLDRADRHRLSLGIAGGVTQYSLDGDKLRYYDEGDVAIPQGMQSSWHPDIRLGVLYTTQRWYAGISVQDLFGGSEADAELLQFNQNTLQSLYRRVHAYYMAGILFQLEPGLKLRPSILVKDDFVGPTAVDINAMLVFNDKLWIGGGYRTRAKILRRNYQDMTADKLSGLNAVMGIAQFHVSPNLRIGYSYDHMLGKMSSLQQGTHEITLGLTFGRNLDRIRNPRYF